ncbi:hypothetical protein K438DRAFT_919141 [Mycena galopus ATCC 62051]|nr:hypothetical protein K438DRAFT_919141 [Mycena galopus ATCC 62051]
MWRSDLTRDRRQKADPPVSNYASLREAPQPPSWYEKRWEDLRGHDVDEVQVRFILARMRKKISRQLAGVCGNNS